MVLVDLRQGQLAGQVRAALADKITDLPVQLVRSLTWDRGKEMAEHVGSRSIPACRSTSATRESPWQRATNKNTNGLLRQYFPKGSDLGLLDRRQQGEEGKRHRLILYGGNDRVL